MASIANLARLSSDEQRRRMQRLVDATAIAYRAPEILSLTAGAKPQRPTPPPRTRASSPTEMSLGL